jgi:hypothetical protein
MNVILDRKSLFMLIKTIDEEAKPMALENVAIQSLISKFVETILNFDGRQAEAPLYLPRGLSHPVPNNGKYLLN